MVCLDVFLKIKTSTYDFFFLSNLVLSINCYIYFFTRIIMFLTLKIENLIKKIHIFREKETSIHTSSWEFYLKLRIQIPSHA